jgi:peroxiredoxin
VVLLAVVLYANRSTGGGAVQGVRAAPAFSLTATNGDQVSLAGLSGKNVLIYFNEGVGCDACFYQMSDIEQHASEFEKAGITVLPISVNDQADVQREMTRFNLQIPWLIDADKSVSEAYGTLGTGMHADLPGHSFVFIDSTGKIRWQQDYPSMYASSDEILSKIRSYL